MSFLPQGYEAPKSDGGAYTKIDLGENKFRIMSSAITGYLFWSLVNGKKKPIRSKDHPGFSPAGIIIDSNGKPDRVSHFWAFIVWNYAKARLEVFEMTQVSLREKLGILAADEDWGDPTEYNIKITKSGSNLETKYDLIGSPQRVAPPQEAIAAFAAREIDLTVLYTGGDPFNPSKSRDKEDAKALDQTIEPPSENW